MHFQPPGMVAYDFFALHAEGQYHMLYLQHHRVPDDDDPDEHSIGHAVSNDLVRWRVEPIALRKGPEGAWDDRTLWTMSIVRRDGLYHMLYTGLSSRDDRRVQRIGLATSPDLYRWEKHPGNPVLEADPCWYETRVEASVQGRVSWRDPFIHHDEPSGWYYALVTARVNAGEAGRRGCVGAARSRDLVRWEALPPVYAPGKYNDHIVPEVFRHGGRYYLLYSAHHLVGTHYAVSDRLLGGYAEPANHWLLGAGGRNAWIGRTVVGADDRRYLLHWNYEREGGTDLGMACHGKIATPKAVRTDESGLLHLEWSDDLDFYAGDAQFDGVPPSLAEGVPAELDAWWTTDGGCVRGERLDGLSILPFDEEGDDVVFDARVQLDGGRAAGVMLRGDGEGHCGYAVLFDADRHAVDLRELPYLDVIESKHLPTITAGSVHALRVAAIGEFLEVYVDGEFAIPATRYAFRRGAFGLVVEGARATFSGLRARPVGAAMA
ncbi:MAG: hypothetical protein FJ033_02145 [Chloroflexi bacterium]|nr:hypothetical protein [Chloroflexota bacterium]